MYLGNDPSFSITEMFFLHPKFYVLHSLPFKVQRRVHSCLARPFLAPLPWAEACALTKVRGNLWPSPTECFNQGSVESLKEDN